MILSFIKTIIASIFSSLARATLLRYKPTVIAVSGSVGKTSAKDAIFAVLRTKHSVIKSEKSYNSEWGVPLAVLGLKTAWASPLGWLLNLLRAIERNIIPREYPKYLVLEMGADKPGDIEKIVKWAKPKAAVITSFGRVPAHVEFFKNRDELIKEDGKTGEALPKDGLLLVNRDDEDSFAMRAKTKAKVLSYGFNKEADIVASNLNLTYGENKKPIGVEFTATFGTKVFPVRIKGALGKTQVYSSLAALLMGEHFGVNFEKGIRALEELETPPGRLKVIAGVKGSTIIDDTYNSSPVAAEEALRVLKEIKTNSKKVAILGDMLELGKESRDEHKRMGEIAGKTTDILITVGLRARAIAEGALNAQMLEKNIFQFEEAKEAGKFVKGILKEGDVVLVKGSQGVRMERVVEEIMARPELKEKLLVRQEREWKN